MEVFMYQSVCACVCVRVIYRNSSILRLGLPVVVLVVLKLHLLLN